MPSGAHSDRSSLTRALLAATVVGLLILAGALLLSSGKSSGPAKLGSGYSNGDLSNTRYSGGPIDQATLAKLQTAWTMPLAAKSPFGAYASTPIVTDGVIYSEDLASNVQAIDEHSGKVLWSRQYETPDQGPNGLAVAGGRVYGATGTSVFALDERTGNQIWSATLVRNVQEGIDMAPGYHNGIVYISTVPGNASQFYEGGGVGILWALDAATGRKIWHFDTAPENLWSNPSVNSGGGVWYSPAFDDQGSMYIGVANPAPFPGTKKYPWGSSRPGPNLYTDSLVKLNAATGKLQWYYQLTPHDLYDWDLQDPPILADVNGRQLVIAAGKSGVVLAFDRQSGKPLWRRNVGTHNGHEHDGLYAMRHEYAKLKLPETVYPGLLGGVITPMASNGSTVFVPVVNYPVTFYEQKSDQEGPTATGELTALNIATGAVRWTHKFPVPDFGSATAVNDLVFTGTFDGTLYAFNANTGAVAWQTKLPAGFNAGVAIDGNTLIAGAGKALAEGQKPELVAFRLGGK